MWLKAPNITCVHGFSTRHGGVSNTPFLSLNLGGSDDDPSLISRNREIALNNLDLSPHSLCYLKQVHGDAVCLANSGRQEGDALVTNEKGKVLAVSIADCYPVLFHDPVNHVIGAAHAGWRGTVSRILANTIREMLKLGAETRFIQVAIGQGISQVNFTVGSEVIGHFREAGFPEDSWAENRIDLVKCNKFVLRENNIPEGNVWSMNRCTFEPDFFSHRRDKGLTGRMWGLISMQ
jgi:YfiH family protein